MTDLATEAPHDESFDLAQLLGRIRTNLRTIVLVVGIFLAIGVGYTYLVPPIYEARATLFFPVRASSVLGPSGIADSSSSGAGALLGGGPSPLKIFGGFLQSQSALKYVEDKSGIDRRKIEASRKFVDDPASNTLTISVFLPSQTEAKELVALHLQALQQINSRLSEYSASGDVTTLSQELEKQLKILRRDEVDLLGFRKRAATAPSLGAPAATGVSSNSVSWGQQLLQLEVNLASLNSGLSTAKAQTEQAQAHQGAFPSDVPPVKKLRPALVDAEYQLRLLQQSMGEDSPEVRRSRERIVVLRQELRDELQAYKHSVQEELVDPTGKNLEQKVAIEAQIEALRKLVRLMPEETGKLERLTRQMALQSDLVKQMTMQLQVAKVQELRDPNKWSLLDPPEAFDKPINKKFVLAALASVLLGLFIGVAWAVNFGRRPSSSQT